jgi:hypothetical protein
MLVLYALVLILSFSMPNRLITLDLGKTKQVTTENNDVKLRFRSMFKLNDNSFNDFEIVMSQLMAKELNISGGSQNKTSATEMRTFFSDHKIGMKVTWYETNDESAKDNYHKDPDMAE